jgi:predicted regulator of Ras-like GTPase activity (Roadblock/LC7/MglB family)
MPFGPVLSTLVARVPGARGAVFCDGEGEFIELAVKDPQLSEFDLKIFGAQIAACWMSLDEKTRAYGAGAAVELRLFCKEGTLLCSALRDGYYLVLLLARNRPTAAAAVELRAASAALTAELA